jgi:8-oxo-dGTP diphosphatase
MNGRQDDPGDEAYLASYDFEAYPRPSVAVDVVLLTAGPGFGALRVMLTRRLEPPQLGLFALPGGFVGLNESLEAAVERVLAQKVGLTDLFTEQLATFGDPGRDPRGRVISVAYYALVPGGSLATAGRPPQPAIAARVRVPWSGERGGPVLMLDEDGQALPLAFDHARIIGAAIARLRGKIWYAPLAFELMPPEFSLAALREIYQMILGRPLNKDSFRKRILATALVAPTGRSEAAVSHRPAELYHFARGITP